MVRVMKNKKKIEFSKIIIFIVGVVTIAVTTFTLYMIWETKDLTALAYLIPAVFTETASATGFYFWKSRTENQLKIARTIKEEKLNEEMNTAKEIVNNSEYM